MGSTNSKIQEPFLQTPTAVVQIPKVNILMVHIWTFRLRHSIKRMAIGNITSPNDERISKRFLPPPSPVGQVPGVSILMVHIWTFRLRRSIKSMAIGNMARPNDERSPFDFLPDELLLEILDYVSLPDLALKLRRLGNRRLRRICEDVSICKHITVDEVWDKGTARAVLSMAGQRMEDLTVAMKKKKKIEYYFDTENAIKTKYQWDRQYHLCDRVEADAVLSTLLSVIDEFDHKITLRKLSIKTKLHKNYFSVSCPLSNTLIANVPSTLQNLTKIDMHDAHFMEGSGRNDWLKSIADHCTYLEHIRLPFMNNLTDQEFTYFLNRVQRTLQYLLVHCHLLTDDSYRTLRHCQHLETLLIESADLIGQEGLRTILELPNLRKLYISDAETLTGADFVNVLQSKEMLKMVCLEMSNVPASAEDITLEILSRSYPNLFALMLYMEETQGPSDVGIRSILFGCRKLSLFTVHRYDGFVARVPLLIEGFHSYYYYTGAFNYCTYESAAITSAKKITSLRYPQLVWRVQERLYVALN